MQCLKVKVTQLCPTLYDSMDDTVHGILHARILEWVAAPFSRESSQPSELGWWPITSPADLPEPGIEPWSPALQFDSLPTEVPGKPQALLRTLAGGK